MRLIHSWKISNSILLSVLAALVLVSVVACGQATDNSVNHSDSQPVMDEMPALAHRVTVSGVSAGAYMAVQTHMAFSDRIAGVGVVAGGPYHCAAGSVVNALGRCMSGDGLDTASLVSYARGISASGEIAAIDELRSARVWIFHSPKDVVVGQQVAVALGDFYREFTPFENIRFVDNIDAAHGWPTLDIGNDCLKLGGDFINACGFDAGGALLNHLYDQLRPRDAELSGEVVRSINLSAYSKSGGGVADAGYIFVPSDCRQQDNDCRLHISFHGCRQGAEFIDDRFAVNAGLNEWAASNRIVVLYPQVESSLMNPQGCWDWWGYTGADYDQKSGKQISVIDALIDAFAQRQLYPLNVE